MSVAVARHLHVIGEDRRAADEFGVLEAAGLVSRAVRGREHWLSIRPEGLRAAERWIAEQTAFWSTRRRPRHAPGAQERAVTAAVVRRVLPAPPEDVYDEWLDPDALREWMCPRPAYATTVECDPRVGGELRLEIDDAGQPMTVTERPDLLAQHENGWRAIADQFAEALARRRV
jgi:Activator of Hsp90 ATPase homolog 1-like protein